MTMQTTRRRALALGAGFIATPALLPAQEAEAIKLRELYAGDNEFSEFAIDHEGERITVEGFMAPPLQADSTFFVLTKMPMSVCPFCETEAEWPEDILAVYTRRVYDVVAFNRKIVVRGELALGSHTDPETGFLSRVRIENARVGYA
jgi:hypothetical protein